MTLFQKLALVAFVVIHASVTLWLIGRIYSLQDRMTELRAGLRQATEWHQPETKATGSTKPAPEFGRTAEEA